MLVCLICCCNLLKTHPVYYAFWKKLLIFIERVTYNVKHVYWYICTNNIKDVVHIHARLKELNCVPDSWMTANIWKKMQSSYLQPIVQLLILNFINRNILMKSFCCDTSLIKDIFWKKWLHSVDCYSVQITNTMDPVIWWFVQCN